jgi:hypothetical protein
MDLILFWTASLWTPIASVLPSGEYWVFDPFATTRDDFGDFTTNTGGVAFAVPADEDVFGRDRAVVTPR